MGFEDVEGWDWVEVEREAQAAGDLCMLLSLFSRARLCVTP